MEESHSLTIKFIDDVQKIKNEKVHSRDEEEEKRLTSEGDREMMKYLEWCGKKFGIRVWKEAEVMGEFVENNDRIKDIAEKMIVGGEGWRTF